MTRGRKYTLSHGGFFGPPPYVPFSKNGSKPSTIPRIKKSLTFGPQKITLKLIYGRFPLGGAEKAPPCQIGLYLYNIIIKKHNNNNAEAAYRIIFLYSYYFLVIFDSVDTFPTYFFLLRKYFNANSKKLLIIICDWRISIKSHYIVLKHLERDT